MKAVAKRREVERQGSTFIPSCFFGLSQLKVLGDIIHLKILMSINAGYSVGTILN
jgi:hypothetical protein